MCRVTSVILRLRGGTNGRELAAVAGVGARHFRNREVPLTTLGLGPTVRTKARIGDLVETEAYERERRAQQRNAEPRRHEPPPSARLQSGVILGPVEHRPPRPL